MQSSVDLPSIAKRLAHDRSRLRFGPAVAHVYNPLTYAWEGHEEYLRRYGRGYRDVLIVGLNAGYFGMAQTGIPFGDVHMVRGWLDINARVGLPPAQHPRRPILGYACQRREISGERLWGWARRRSSTPQRFFARFFVVNYCPLCFLETSGANLTPDHLPKGERDPLFALCNRALTDTARALRVRYAIGLGRFIEGRLKRVLGDLVLCGGAPHPSPGYPQSGVWADKMDLALAALGIN